MSLPSAAVWLAVGLLAGPLEAATPPTRSPAEITDFRIGNIAQMQQRALLLQRGEASLAEGDTTAAIDTFDRAAMMLHAPDTEMALVRAHVQAGEYRRALAVCAHTAGAHRETVAPSVLYAWLLRVGGQADYAVRVLAEAQARAPDDAVLSAAMRTLAGTAPRAEGVLLDAPQRMAPYPVQRGGGAPLPAAARVVGSGALIDAGRHALVPAGAVGTAATVWLRNGLGEATSATVAQRIDPLGLVLLALAQPLDPGPALQLAPRDPFAGSPGFAIGYAATPDAAPAWPGLHTGFVGGVFASDAGSALRRLGIALPAGVRGGPVFDAAGRLAGVTAAAGDVAVSDAVGDRFVPISAWRQALGAGLVAPAAIDAPASAARPARLPNDEAYERALRVAVQLIVAR